MPKQPTGPTYPALFAEASNTFCSASSLAAIDSPVAYLRALYTFALQVEQTGQGTQPKITLANRRPKLKDLILDTQNTASQIPLLTIINETLNEHIDTYLANNQDLYQGKSTHQVLAELRYPFQLPFDLAHQQCAQGLSGKKPPLGELNYRISLKLPYSQQPENKYGTVQQEAYEAQRLLSNLSPAQQTLLTEALIEQDSLTHFISRAFLKKHYGTEQPITEQQPLMLATGLDANNLYALLAQGNNRPRLSTNVLNAPKQAAGACYINGPGGQQPLSLGSDSSGTFYLKHATANHYDRLQRMIRLQRWLSMPFAELDTLLFSAMSCEKGAAEPLKINDNSLRMLGVYRHLSRRYSLKPEEFSALLHQMPVHATSGHSAFFDQVFNQPPLFGTPLVLDDSPLDLSATDAATQSTLYQVCAALHLNDTPQSFGLIKSRTHRYIATPGKNLATLSSLYRQAKIAALFGLSVMECEQLADLLGGESYRQQLVTPSLRDSGSNAPADFLDVLMQMDWAVSWLNDSSQSVQQLQQQLLLDSTTVTPPVQRRLKQLEQALTTLQTRLMPQAEIDALDLPQPEPSLQSAPLSWNQLLVRGILRSHPLLPKAPDLSALESGVSRVIGHITFSQHPDTDKALKYKAKAKLKTHLLSAYQRLQPFKQDLQPLIEDTSLGAEVSGLFEHAYKHIFRILLKALGTENTQQTLKQALLFVPNAESDLQLTLSRPALHSFLLNPHWLDTEDTANSSLKLGLASVYLFQRFNHLINHYGVDQDSVLNYFQLANQAGDPIAHNQRLCAMLGWSETEVETLANRLPEKRARSMAELDWLMRCHETAKTTGLSASLLLMATGLTTTFSSDDWKQVGEAVTAAHQ